MTYEYKTLTMKYNISEWELNRYGQEGWKVISITKAGSNDLDTVYTVIMQRESG